MPIAADWPVLGVLLAGAYRLAERQFRGMEIPPRPLRYTIVDWSQMR